MRLFIAVPLLFLLAGCPESKTVEPEAVPAVEAAPAPAATIPAPAPVPDVKGQKAAEDALKASTPVEEPKKK